MLTLTLLDETAREEGLLSEEVSKPDFAILCSGYLIKENDLSVAYDTVVYWVRSVSGDVRDRVPAYFKGALKRGGLEGQAGDLRLRPVSLGPGDYTMVVNPYDVEDEFGNLLKLSREGDLLRDGEEKSVSRP